MQPLEHRVAMTSLLFDGVEGIRVVQANADDRFGGGELWELLEGVRQLHRAATVFVILGSDALRWYAGLTPGQRPRGVQILVNDRHDGPPLPSSVDGQPVHTIDDLDRGLSSTAIREALRDGRPAAGLTAKVADYVRRHEIYREDACSQVEPS